MSAQPTLPLWPRLDIRDRLFVVPCSATKSRILATQPMAAGDAYTGQAFRIAKATLQAAGAKWCILSAYYGFLWPTSTIEFYDLKMEPLKPNEAWDEAFGALTNRQYAKLLTAQRVTVLGSHLYCNAAETLLQRPVERPVAGLPIGRMLSALKHAAWLRPELAATA
jgi:hypothetical protein